MAINQRRLAASGVREGRRRRRTPESAKSCVHQKTPRNSPSEATRQKQVMSVLFLIPGPLRGFTDGRSEVRLDQSPVDVGQALAGLWSLAPALRDRILDEQGQIRQHVNLFVGSESIRFTGGLSTAVTDGAEIMIVPAVSGG